jgi:CheY-like chemotaxis protein
MSDNLGTFSDTAKTLSRNPLGIIALFIVLVYGMAALVLGTSANGLGTAERVLLVLFLVGFPPGVLWVFRDLVMNHTARLYSPSDFKDEENFVEMTRTEARVMAQLTAATARSGTGLAAAPGAEQARISVTARLATTAAFAGSHMRKFLWVDDKPENNIHERKAFAEAGFAVQTALSTDEALRLAARESFDVIISDMARPEGEEAGFDLIEKLRATGNQTHVIIYCGVHAPGLAAAARERGAFGCTNDPGQLLRLVSAASLL